MLYNQSLVLQDATTFLVRTNKSHETLCSHVRNFAFLMVLSDNKRTFVSLVLQPKERPLHNTVMIQQLGSVGIMSTIVSNVHSWEGGGEFGEPPTAQLSKSVCDNKQGQARGYLAPKQS